MNYELIVCPICNNTYIDFEELLIYRRENDEPVDSYFKVNANHNLSVAKGGIREKTRCNSTSITMSFKCFSCNFIFEKTISGHKGQYLCF